MELKIRFPSFAYLMLAISYFTVLVNPLGWHMLLHVSPLYFLFIILSASEGKSHLPKEDRFYVQILFFFLIFNSISMLFISNLPGTSGKVLRHFTEFICLYYFLCYCRTESNLNYLIKMYAYSAIAIAFKMFFQRSSFPRDPNRYSIYNFTHVMDPNFLAALFVFPAIFYFNKCLQTGFKSKNTTIFAILLSAVMMTGSRGGVFGIGIGCIILWCTQKKSNKTVIFGVLFPFILLVLAYFLLPSALARLDVRVDADGSNTLRFNLWATCWRIFLSSPIYGRGGNSMIVLGMNYGARVNIMAHNSFLEILADYGIVGFILFYAGSFMLIVRAIRDKIMIVVAIMLGTIGTSFFISAQDSAFWWQNYMFSIVMYWLMKTKYYEKK